MQAGDIIQHQGLIIRIKSFYVDDEGITVIDGCDVLDFYWPWIVEHNGLIKEKIKGRRHDHSSNARNVVEAHPR